MLTVGRGRAASVQLTRWGRGTVAPRTTQETNLKPRVPSNLLQHQADAAPRDPSRWEQGSSLTAKPRVNAVPGV